MTKKDLASLMPKAKSGDLRILVSNGRSSIVSVVPFPEIEDQIKAFEKRASLDQTDVKNPESHGSVRLWCENLLETENPDKNSLSLIPQAALWMSLRHWKYADRQGKKLKDLAKRKQTPHLTVTTTSGGNTDAEKIAESAWTFALNDNFDVTDEMLAESAKESVRVV